MSATRFRTLLIFWVILFVSRFVFDPGLPPEAEALSPSVSDYAANIPVLITAGLFFLALPLGVVGMFLFWRPAPYIFIGAPLLAVLTSPLVPYLVMAGWVYLFEGVTLMFAGVLFALAVYGPARPLFR